MRKWSDVEKELFTPEEIRESKLRVAIIGELIKARDEKIISQAEFERLSGEGEPLKSSMETENIMRLDTVLKVLAPLGKTLYVGDLQEA